MVKLCRWILLWFIMSKRKSIILIKELPDCPIGTEFYLSMNEKYYSNDITKEYIFSIDEVESNIEFFYHGDKTSYDLFRIWNQVLPNLSPKDRYLNPLLGLDLSSLFKEIDDAG